MCIIFDHNLIKMASQIVNGCLACAAPRPSYRRTYRRRRTYKKSTYGGRKGYRKYKKGAKTEAKKVTKIVREIKRYGPTELTMGRANKHLDALNARTARYIERIKKAQADIEAKLALRAVPMAVAGGALSSGLSSSFKPTNLGQDISAA